jgi:hypothetical protein
MAWLRFVNVLLMTGCALIDNIPFTIVFAAILISNSLAERWG